MSLDSHCQRAAGGDAGKAESLALVTAVKTGEHIRGGGLGITPAAQGLPL